METEELAELLKDVVSQICDVAKSQQETPPDDFLVFTFPGDDSWHFSFFYTDNEKMRRAITDGSAYDLTIFTRANLYKMEAVPQFPLYLWFDGFEWFDVNDHNPYLDRIRAKIIQWSLPSEEGTCSQCRHKTADHEMIGPKNPETGAMRRGWMICPHEDCNCFSTWDLDAH